MKHPITITMIFFLLLLLNCTGNQKLELKYQKESVDIEKNDTLKIVSLVEKDRIMLYNEFIDPEFLQNGVNLFLHNHNSPFYNIRDIKHRINYILKKGDDVTIKTDKGYLVFITTSKEKITELNYYTENYKYFNKPISGFYFQVALLEKKYTNNPSLREQEFKNEYNGRINFLNNYTKKHNLSNTFKHFSSLQIKYDILEKRLLLTPVSIKSFPEWYLDSLCSQTINEFGNDEMLYYEGYRESAFNLSYLISLENKNYLGVENHYNTIIQCFSGKTKDFLLLKLLGRVVFGKYSSDNEVLKAKKLAKRYYNDCQTFEYKEYLRKSLDLENTSIGNNELISTNKRIKLFSQINNNQISYIDFWASWCGPCRAEMPDSKKLKIEYNRKGINFVYVSIDKNPVAWERASTQIGLSEYESYLLPKSSESEIVKQFKIASIPRYMIIDRDGRVINADAPRPSDPKLSQIFDELLKK